MRLPYWSIPGETPYGADEGDSVCTSCWRKMDAEGVSASSDGGWVGYCSHCKEELRYRAKTGKIKPTAPLQDRIVRAQQHLKAIDPNSRFSVRFISESEEKDMERGQLQLF